MPFPTKEDWDNPDFVKQMIVRKKEAHQPIPDNWPKHVRVLAGEIEPEVIAESKQGEVPEAAPSIKAQVEKAIGPIPKEVNPDGTLPKIKGLPPVDSGRKDVKDKVGTEDIDIPFDVVGMWLNDDKDMKLADKKIDTSEAKNKQLNRLWHRAFPDIKIPPILAFFIALFAWIAPYLRVKIPKFIEWIKKVQKEGFFGKKTASNTVNK